MSDKPVLTSATIRSRSTMGHSGFLVYHGQL